MKKLLRLIKKLQGKKGFTLVELAIVLTIIGLLIGGILKGQQLISNARVTAQIAQFQAVQAATTSFQDAFAGLPGDLLNATTRVANIGACPNGDGNGVVGPAGTTVASDAWTTGGTLGKGEENICFWAELSGAGYLAGITQPGVAGAWGQSLPIAKLGSGLVVTDEATAPYSGLYVTDLQSTANPTSTKGANAMTPSQAAQIDRKMDDGNSSTGSILGTGYLTNCQTGGTTGAYVETSTSNDCDVSYKLQ